MSPGALREEGGFWVSAYLLIASMPLLCSAEDADEDLAAWAIARFGELCRFLAAKKIIRASIASAKMASAIKRPNGMPSANNPPPAGWATGG